jgi:hypothetical protein
MKNVSFIIVLFSLISCEEDVDLITLRFKDKDNVFWRLCVHSFLGPNGSLVIKAYLEK